MEELAQAGQWRHKQISVTTVRALLAAGVPVIPSPGKGYHATAVTNISIIRPPPGQALDPLKAAELSTLFNVQPNPYPVIDEKIDDIRQLTTALR